MHIIRGGIAPLIHLMNAVAAGRTIDLNQFALRPTDHACLVICFASLQLYIAIIARLPDSTMPFPHQQALSLDHRSSRPNIRDRHILDRLWSLPVEHSILAESSCILDGVCIDFASRIHIFGARVDCAIELGARPGQVPRNSHSERRLAPYRIHEKPLTSLELKQFPGLIS